MQLIKIKSIPLEYDMKINHAKLTIPQIDSATVKLKSTPAQVDIKTEDIKVRMDSSEMRSSIGMKSFLETTREAPAKTQRTANETTSEYVKEGNAMTQKGMSISQYMKQKMLSDTFNEVSTNIGIAPSHTTDLSWEPATIKTTVKKGKLDSQVEKPDEKMEFIPSSITLEVRQLADIEIEYLGGFRYVPPSSDPNYKGK